jgi:hypothetical protein
MASQNTAKLLEAFKYDQGWEAEVHIAQMNDDMVYKPRRALVLLEWYVGSIEC